MVSYKQSFTYDTDILQMSMLLSKKNESTSQNITSTQISTSSFIHNSQNLEKLKRLSPGKRINKLSHTHTIVTILQ